MAHPALIPVFPEKVHASSDFKPDEFYGEIKAHGIRVLWEQATPCPCSDDIATEDGRMGCPVCAGTGWEYETGQEIRAIVTGLLAKDSPFMVDGRFEFGDVLITVPPEQTPGFRDRYTLLDSVMVVQDLVKRTGATDRLRWPVAQRGLYLSVSGVPTSVAVSVLRLRRQANDGTVGAVLDIGTDFAVDANGAIVWALGDVRLTAPAVGQRYAARYYGHPRYVVMERPRAIRDTNTAYLAGARKAMPKQYAPLPVASMCRLDWERRT